MANSFDKRHPRGNYASLICVGCSNRKIKCRLPGHIDIQPSDRPQPEQSACQRCRDFGLECIVRYTVLGRPASRRKRASEVRVKTDAPSAGSSATLPLEEETFEEGVKIYLLSELPEDRSPSPRDEPMTKAKTDDMFNAMVSGTHLMAAVLASNRNFGSLARSTEPDARKPLTQLISNGMATLLDEQ